MIISFYSIQTKSNKRHFHFNIRNAKRLFIFVPSWYIFFISCASVYEVTFYTLSFSTKTYSSPVKIKISITKMESAFFVSLVSLHCISFCRENYNYDFHIVFTCISFDMQFFFESENMTPKRHTLSLQFWQRQIKWFRKVVHSSRNASGDLFFLPNGTKLKSVINKQQTDKYQYSLLLTKRVKQRKKKQVFKFLFIFLDEE